MALVPAESPSHARSILQGGRQWLTVTGVVRHQGVDEPGSVPRTSSNASTDAEPNPEHSTCTRRGELPAKTGVDRDWDIDVTGGWINGHLPGPVHQKKRGVPQPYVGFQEVEALNDQFQPTTPRSEKGEAHANIQGVHPPLGNGCALRIALGRRQGNPNAAPGRGPPDHRARRTRH